MNVLANTEGRQRVASTAQRILLAAITLAVARTILFALKDEYLASGLLGLGARSASRHVLESFAACLVPTAAVAVGSSLLAGRRRQRWVLVTTLLTGLVAAYLFVSFRLPSRAYYAPQFDGARAYAAHGGAVLVALVVMGFLTPFFRVPLLKVSSLGAVFLVLVPAAALHLRGAGDVQAAAAPNVILISLDTLRADRLGCYGYEQATSPEIDRFSRDAVVFTQAYSPQPFTLTAHMSMLTSLYPTAHGVGTERGLSHNVPTLATLLGREGYATLAVVDVAHWMSPKFGFDRGFDLYHVMPNYAEVKIDGILSLIDDLDREPFFLFAHFYDVHSDKTQLPYESDREDMTSFAGWYDGDFTGCNDQQECASELLYAMARRREVLGGDDLEYISSLYDAGVRTLDRKLRRLFDGLEQRGLFESSVILLTADHGEEFFEHGRAMHTQNFDECLRVPFILRPPGGRAGTSDVIASLVDVVPTLLDFCGTAPELTQGVSLAPLVTGGELGSPREHVLIDGKAPQLGLRTQRWSLVPTGRGLAAFDVTQDPGQVHEVSLGDGSSSELARLRVLLNQELERLDLMREHLGPGRRAELSGKDLEALRELGYVGD